MLTAVFELCSSLLIAACSAGIARKMHRNMLGRAVDTAQEELLFNSEQPGCCVGKFSKPDKDAFFDTCTACSRCSEEDEQQQPGQSILYCP